MALDLSGSNPVEILSPRKLFAESGSTNNVLMMSSAQPRKVWHVLGLFTNNVCLCVCLCVCMSALCECVHVGMTCAAEGRMGMSMH